MDEQENKPRIVPPTTINAARESLLTETFDVYSNPTVDEIIRTMAKLANFLNLYAAEALRSRVVTAANPSTQAILNAAGNLENGAQAQRMQLAAIAAGQFAGVPGGGPGPGGPGGPPFRMN